MIIKILYIVLVLAGFSTSAQEILTAEEAVRIALENNYQIRIANNDLKIDKTNVTIGNAGFLPRVDAVFNDNNSVQNSSQTRSDGTVNELDNARNNSLNYGVNLGWTVFDGFRMFARYDQLKELKKLGEAELRLTVLGRVGDVLSTYYEIVQRQTQLTALDTAIVISNQRVTTAQNRFTIGKASKLEVLNAQVDLNTDASTRARQLEQLAIAKVRLNELLARNPATEFKTEEAFEVDTSLTLAPLQELSAKQNPLIQAQIISKRVAELQLKQVKAGRYPTISVNTGYNWAESESSLGFTSQSSARGLTYGFGATMNIFDGFNQRRNEHVAKLQVENSSIVIDQQTLAVSSQLASAFQTYLTNVELIRIEKQNQALARQNLDITLEKYRIGTIPTLEFRTAQLNYINAVVRNSEAQYQAKLSEVLLRELAGNLTF